MAFHEKLGFFMLILDFIRVKRKFAVTIHDSDFYHLNKEALEKYYEKEHIINFAKEPS